MSVDRAAAEEVLTGLADPMRRRILDALAAHGTATATALAAELPISRQAVMKHLALLDRIGLVAGQRAGREMRYEPRPDRLTATAHWMAALATEWDRRLRLIKQIAEAAGSAGES
jgi:DNA-binding transcriptional ArsR family regulator